MRGASDSRSEITRKRTRRVMIWIGISLVLTLLLGYVGISTIAANLLTLPKRIFKPELNPGKYNLEFEDLVFPARGDSVKIAAWYIPSEEKQRAIILVHGRDNSRTNGFVNQFISFANQLHQAGFSVLMIDLRGHGQSEDSRFHFGTTEYQDILGAVDWLETRGYEPGKIGVLGYSLGAASVIKAAAEEEDIGAIWIDSAYADIKPVIENGWAIDSGLPQVFLYSTKLMIRILYGYNITESRPIDEIGEVSPRPIFIAHCEKDRLIPISNMQQLVSKVPDAQTWVIPNCDQDSQNLLLVDKEHLNNHALGYNLQPDVYEQKVIEFFSENLQ